MPTPALQLSWNLYNILACQANKKKEKKRLAALFIKEVWKREGYCGGCLLYIEAYFIDQDFTQYLYLSLENIGDIDPFEKIQFCNICSKISTKQFNKVMHT